MDKTLPIKPKLTPQQKLKIIQQARQNKKSVVQICKENNISRAYFYKLKNKLEKAGDSHQEKVQALTPKQDWQRKGKTLSTSQIKELIKEIIRHPKQSVLSLYKQICLKKTRNFISYTGIKNLLEKIGLDTKQKRETFSSWAKEINLEELVDLIEFSLDRYYESDKALDPEDRLKAIRLVDHGALVSHISNIFHITRKNFYKWYRRYHQSAPGKEYQAVVNQKPEIDRYWNQVPEEKVKEILNLVANQPELSSHKLAVRVKGVGNHGVQNVLKRNDLNTMEKRRIYAQDQKQAIPIPAPVVADVPRPEVEVIPTVAAKPPPPSFINSIKSFIASLITSTLISFIIFSSTFYYINIFSQAPTLSSKLGLIFASLALLAGSFFFIYSMKYYLTIAVVLSFSRHSLEEGQISIKSNGNNKSFFSWLKKAFAGNGNSVSLDYQQSLTSDNNGHVTGGGLQPNLDHIQLLKKPFVSVHLPLYNEKRVVERLLKACTSFNYHNDSGQPNFEIIVCDDSTDETIEIIDSFVEKYRRENPNGPEIKVLRRPARDGFKGAALQNALSFVNPKTEFISVFDADFVPYADTLELFVKYFKINNHNQENYTQSNIAVVGGYQWHVLNKSENWITRGVRSEYAGSYVIERSGREIMGLLKQISGSVYMIRADVLKKIGWGTSITEDFELTLKLYEKGYKVVYTPYVQAPAECVSTLKRLIRQRMRWAEGHSSNIKKMFTRLIDNPNLSFGEKLEFLYPSPYYFQAFFFLVGTMSWLISETVFRARLPFWTSLWGWSLVLTNFFALPLVNAVGLFLEESEEKDYIGLFSFVFLSYLIVPFQAYAALKGFLQKEEGPWFRTPKTGKVTDIFKRGKFYRWIAGILPGRGLALANHFKDVLPQPALALFQGYNQEQQPDNSINPLNSYLALATANSQFEGFKIRQKKLRWVSKAALAMLLIFSVSLYSLTRGVPEVLATNPSGTFNLDSVDSSLLTGTNWKLLDNTSGSDGSLTLAVSNKSSDGEWWQYKPAGNNASEGSGVDTCAEITPDGNGWIFETPFGVDGYISSGTWTFYFNENDNRSDNIGNLEVCVWRVTISSSAINTYNLIYSSDTDGSWPSTDIWDGLKLFGIMAKAEWSR